MELTARPHFFIINENELSRLATAPELANLYSLAVLVPSIAVGVRRMHDVGKSGWFLLIPIYNLILAVTEGEKGENEYGQEPVSE